MFCESISPEIIWAIFGVILLVMELFIPGVVISFFGLGALITALTTYLNITSSLDLQLVVFIVTSTLSLLLFRKYIKKLLYSNSNPLDDDKYNVEIGKIVSVIELIEPDEIGGKVRYQGAPWSAECSERVGPGDSVKIIGFRNLTLIVEKIKKEIK
ncbi:MAG: NfeD family protein [Candidatus Delongbacteria bacterium]|nr:NfeD family protein [Candidatus Delongbacteria bacterium]